MLRTGRKWKASCEIDYAQKFQTFKEVMGYPQSNRQGFEQICWIVVQTLVSECRYGEF